MQRLRNQPEATIGSVIANRFLALVVGSVYYNLPDNSDNINRRTVLIFFSLVITAYSPAFEVSLLLLIVLYYVLELTMIKGFQDLGSTPHSREA